MKQNSVENIREEFRRLKSIDKQSNGTYEIRNAQFIVDSPVIFGTPNQDYIEAELQWYELQSLEIKDLFDIYGKEVKIWKDIATKCGRVNSNYGWAIYSKDNYNQYAEVLKELTLNPASRQAVMYYTRPTMHVEKNIGGMKDCMCTTHVVYSIVNGYLEASVYMRSNDAIFGYMNDVEWQRYVNFKLANDLKVIPGTVTWNATSLHIYERHWDLIK